MNKSQRERIEYELNNTTRRYNRLESKQDKVWDEMQTNPSEELKKKYASLDEAMERVAYKEDGIHFCLQVLGYTAIHPTLTDGTRDYDHWMVIER
jgi:hypothetical protein